MIWVSMGVAILVPSYCCNEAIASPPTPSLQQVIEKVDDANFDTVWHRFSDSLDPKKDPDWDALLEVAPIVVPKTGREFLPTLIPFLQHKPSRIHDALAKFKGNPQLLSVFAPYIEMLSEPQRTQLYKQLVDHFPGGVRPADAKQGTDPCAVLCTLIEKHGVWAKLDDLFSEDSRNAEKSPVGVMDNGVRVSALALFGTLILRSQKHCPSAIKKAEQITGEFFSGAVGSTERPFAGLRELMVKKREIADYSVGDIYGPIFSVYFLYALQQQDLTAPQRAQAAALTKRLLDEVREQVALGDRLRSVPKGSGNVNYSMYIKAPVLQPLPENLYKMLHEPGMTPYATDTPIQDIRGDVSRTLGSKFVAYLVARAPTDKEHAKADWKQAFDLLRTDPVFDLLIAHTARDGAHSRPSGIAPYYSYPNFLFSFPAIAYFKDQGLINETDRLYALEKFMQLRQSDGTFVAMGSHTYPASAIYTNSMAGLALLPMIEACTDSSGRQKPVKRSYGIYPPKWINDEAPGRLQRQEGATHK